MKSNTTTPPTKAKPAKKKALLPGLTQMTREKHNYDGFIVRRSLNRYGFHRYVGAGKRVLGKGSVSARFDTARDRAVLALDALDRIILEPNSWRTADGKKHLTKKAALALGELGFKIKSPA
jgi:hypothetical protein